MKFPEPKTLRGAMSPVILTNWVFSIGIFEYPKGHPRPGISLCWSIANFSLFMSFIVLAQLSGELETPHSTISVDTYRVFILAGILSLISILCLGRTASKHLVTSIHKLNKVNEMLSEYEIPKEYGLTFKYQIIQLIGAFLFVSMILAMNTFGFIHCHNSRKTYYGYLATEYYLPICGHIVDCTFTSLIGYIGNRFKHLNANLIQCSFRDNNTQSFLEDLQLDDSLQPTTLGIHANPYLFGFNDKKWMLQLVCNSRKIHQELCSTARTLNKAFGIQILLSITMSSVLITTMLYGMYNLLVTSTSMSSSINIVQAMVIVFWLIYYTAKVLYTVSVCSMTSTQAQRMGELIHQLDNPTTDIQVREEIHAFSLLLMQNPLRFTASGFFTLDYETICSMAGTVTTYLVIMIQLHDVYDPASGSTTAILGATNATN